MVDLRNAVDLDCSAAPQDCLSGASYRNVGGKEFLVDLIHSVEGVQVYQMYRGLDNTSQTAPWRLQNLRQVAQFQARLRPDIAEVEFLRSQLIGACPAVKTNPPATIACEYGSSGLGNSGELTTQRSDDVIEPVVNTAANNTDAADAKNAMQFISTRPSSGSDSSVERPPALHRAQEATRLTPTPREGSTAPRWRVRLPGVA
jgi:hypothetical protein